MTVYIDADYKCHATDNGAMKAVETDFFDGKCVTFIEGYRYIPSGESWTREDGMVFNGKIISPWKDYRELAAAQKQYELDEAIIAELDAALLDATYQNLLEEYHQFSFPTSFRFCPFDMQ